MLVRKIGQKLSYISDESTNWHNHFGKDGRFWQFFIKVSMPLSYKPEILLLGIYPKEMNACIRKNICTKMFTLAFF